MTWHVKNIKRTLDSILKPVDHKFFDDAINGFGPVVSLKIRFAVKKMMKMRSEALIEKARPVQSTYKAVRGLNNDEMNTDKILPPGGTTSSLSLKGATLLISYVFASTVPPPCQID